MEKKLKKISHNRLREALLKKNHFRNEKTFKIIGIN